MEDSSQIAVEVLVGSRQSAVAGEDRHDVEVGLINAQVLDEVSSNPVKPDFLSSRQRAFVAELPDRLVYAALGGQQRRLMVRRVLDHRDDVRKCNVVAQLVRTL